MSAREGPLSQQALAILEAADESPTPYGGVTVAWTLVGTVWISLKRAPLREAKPSEEHPPEAAQSALATARDHPAAAAGQRLTVAGEAPFRVREVRRDAADPGAMTLVLDRLS